MTKCGYFGATFSFSFVFLCVPCVFMVNPFSTTKAQRTQRFTNVRSPSDIVQKSRKCSAAELPSASGDVAQRNPRLFVLLVRNLKNAALSTFRVSRYKPDHPNVRTTPKPNTRTDALRKTRTVRYNQLRSVRHNSHTACPVSRQVP